MPIACRVSQSTWPPIQQHSGLKFLAILCVATIFACGSTDATPRRTVQAGPTSTATAGSGGAATIDPGQPIPPIGNIGGFENNGGVNGFPRGTARITGTVWAPGNAPGSVPKGHEIPVFNALIELANAPQPPAPEKAYCEVCIPSKGIAVSSNHKGEFTLPSAPAGKYWLSIRKGQFRIDRQVTIAEGQTLSLDAAATTLPSSSDPAAGHWIPKMALVVGLFDVIEDVLGKMGIGGLQNSPKGPVWNEKGPGAERVDIFSNDGRSYTRTRGTIADLLRNREAMLSYHVIFVGCSGYGFTQIMSAEPEIARNVRDFVAEGGKLYVTDWSSYVSDNAFPEQLRFGPDRDNDALPGAYDRENDRWNPGEFMQRARTRLYDSPNAESVDDDLSKWITGQKGPSARGNTEETFNPKQMLVVDSFQRIEEAKEVSVGVDADKNVVVDKPHVYVMGSEDKEPTKRPLTVTFQPAGCGRVLFSTYHTSEQPHAGLHIQERLLLYLIMEVTLCRTEPVPITPVVK